MTVNLSAYQEGLVREVGLLADGLIASQVEAVFVAGNNAEARLEAVKAKNRTLQADVVEWRNTAYAAKGHYEQSDARLAEVERVCRDAETMQWADISRAYGDGVVAAVGWVRAAARAIPAAVSVAPQPEPAKCEPPANDERSPVDLMRALRDSVDAAKKRRSSAGGAS
jgi:hypothetical protein